MEKIIQTLMEVDSIIAEVTNPAAHNIQMLTRNVAPCIAYKLQSKGINFRFIEGAIEIWNPAKYFNNTH